MNDKTRIIAMIAGGGIIVGIVVLLIVGSLLKGGTKQTVNTPTVTPMGINTGSQATATHYPTPELSPTEEIFVTPAVTVSTDDNAHNLELNHQFHNQPDLFVSNFLPYETQDFAASSDFTESPTSHFYFVVVLKNSNNNLSMEKFHQWLLSLGLEQQQIAQLDIRYKSE